MRNLLFSKLKESVFSVLPVMATLLLLNLIAPTPMSTYEIIAFIAGGLFLIFGMTLYSIGTSSAVEPMGDYIGSKVSKSKNIPFILFVCAFIGIIVTIAEPDLSVLASQVAVPSTLLIVTISVGVGLFLLLAMARIIFKWNYNLILIVCYFAIMIMGIFVPSDFLALAFDSGGVTTGPITVPFIMALATGVAMTIGGKNQNENSFGIIGLCSVGPIIAVMLLGLIFNPSSSTENEVIVYNSLKDIASAYLHGFPDYLLEVGIALLPIVVFFYIYNFIAIKLPKAKLMKITVGVIYLYLGLTLFLTGVGVGFMSAGFNMGSTLFTLDYNYILIPIGVIVGLFVVFAEPAIHVLTRQVEELTSGNVKRKTMFIFLAVALSGAVGLSVARAIYKFSIWYILIPGYALALLTTFFCPKIFTAIAFDSGGVASGPMTASFILPFIMGICSSGGGNVMLYAFGSVATVALMPLLTIQFLGITYNLKVRKSKTITVVYDQNIVDFNLDDFEI